MINPQDLKLRLWNSEKGRMVKRGAYRVLVAIQDGTIDGNHFTLVRCTNKKDVDGNEIYERDILSHCFMDEYPDKKGIVELSNGCWMIRAEGTDRRRFLFDTICWANLNSYPYELKVIGNVFENPDLINE